MKQTKILACIYVLGTLILSLSCPITYAAEFSDVSPNDAYYDAISEISGFKIINGYEDGSFKPDNYVTKTELAVMIARMTPYDFFDASQYPQLFSDVSAEHWAYSYISKAAYCGVFSTFNNTEYSDDYLGTTAVTVPNIENPVFSPNSNVTYAEAVKAITTLLGYNGTAEKNGGYPDGYLFTAKVFGFTDNIREYGADEYITRADFALMACNALDIHWCIANTDSIETELIHDNVDYIKYDGYIIYSKLNENTLRDIITREHIKK